MKCPYCNRFVDSMARHRCPARTLLQPHPDLVAALARVPKLSQAVALKLSQAVKYVHAYPNPEISVAPGETADASFVWRRSDALLYEVRFRRTIVPHFWITFCFNLEVEARVDAPVEVFEEVREEEEDKELQVQVRVLVEPARRICRNDMVTMKVRNMSDRTQPFTASYCFIMLDCDL